MQIQPRLLNLGKNPHGRDFVIGDMHGCVSALLAQLQALTFNPRGDRVICVGDLVNRGPESVQALALLSEPWFFAVIGNHEQLLVSAFQEGQPEHHALMLQHGGDWILQQPRQHWDGWFTQIRQLPLAIQLENNQGKTIGIIHADYPLADWGDFHRLTSDDAERAIWAHEPFRQRSPHRVAGLDWLIVGHNVTEQPLQLGNRLYIDRGVYLGNDYQIIDINQL